MTATTGRTVLAIVAILSLLLSAFAIARPVIAAHDDGTPEVTGYRDATRENEGGNITSCLYGATLERFDSAQEADSASGTIDGIPYTIEYTISDGKLTFFATGALVTEALIKGGPATTIYDYSGFPGGGIAHDDGLFATEGGISNVGFCLIPIEASILIYKTDQTQADVAGAEFTVYDGETVVGGPTATDANGLVCFDGLVLDKSYTVVETTVPGGYIGADSQTVAASLGNCEDRIADGDEADAVFTNTLLGAIVIYKTDQTGADVADAVFTVEGKEGTFTTGADGTFCVAGLVVGDTVTVTETVAPEGYELANPASQDVTITQAGDCEAHSGTPDATFTNNLLGSLLVLKTDDSDEPLEGAEFSITGPGEFATTDSSDADGWFCLDGLTYGAEYTVTETAAPDGYLMDTNNPQKHVIDDSATCAERVADSPTADLVFVNAEEAEETGSITVNKEFEDCGACEAFTPGYWFNRGGGGGVDWANEWLTNNPQTIAGIGTFADVGDVQAYLDWDISGGDGANGLSATGQLLRHYLALVLNVAFAEANDCDLASMEYDGTSIADWLAMALDALETGASDGDKEAIKDALDAINNSDAGDGTLECPTEGTGGSVAGFTFKLWVFDEEAGELVVVDEMTTDESGSVTFDGLELGVEYTITEVAPEGLECTIVSAWMGETELEVVDGMITVTLAEGEETANVTITVVNDCEQPGEEDEFGDVVIIKDAGDDTDEPFGFSASWTGGGLDFDLTGGQAWPSGDVPAGTVITVTEELTAEQMLAGWSFEGIDCGDADVSVEGATVTITVVANTTITCTFTNELEEPDGEAETVQVSIMKHLCADVATVAEFEAIEDAGVAGLPGGDGTLSGLAATVLACPTIVLTGDLPTPGAVSSGNVDFDFTVIDSEGNQVLSTDGAFEQAALCEVGIDVDVNEDGDKLDCLDTSHYMFEVVDGIVVITETDAPTGHRFGTIRFTPGSDDADALVGSIASVEATGVIRLDTRADADDAVMVHVYNFVTEGTQGGGSGPGQKPREGTAGGNPLPNTATAPISGSVPAVLLALAMLTGLGAAGYAMQAEARRRR